MSTPVDRLFPKGRCSRCSEHDPEVQVFTQVRELPLGKGNRTVSRSGSFCSLCASAIWLDMQDLLNTKMATE